MSKIHPAAIVDAGAKLADDVEIGPGCVIDSDVTVGAGTVLRENVVIRKYTTLGERNFVDAFCVLGGEPQDRKFDPSTVSHLRIGDDNLFREQVTISRGTDPGSETVVGSGTFWMAGAHAGHNATIEDEAVLVNGTAVAGHATIGRRAFLGGGAMIHQFTWVGEMVMVQGHGGVSMHTPPFTLLAGVNRLVGLNSVGLRRAEEITTEDRAQIKTAFRLLYRSGLSAADAMAQMDAQADWGAPAGRFRDFCRRALAAEPPYKRGLCQLRRQ